MNDIKNKIVETSALLVGLCAQLDEQMNALEPGRNRGWTTFDTVAMTAKEGKVDQQLTERINRATLKRSALDKLTKEERAVLLPYG